MIRIRDAAVFLALGLSVLLGVVLANRARDLSAQNALLAERLRMAHPGMYVPTLTLETTTGAPIVLGGSDHGTRQLLYFFTTTCPHCRASIPAWKEVALAGRVHGIEVIGVAIDSTRSASEYSIEHGLTLPIVTSQDRRFASLYRVGGVPLIVLVDENGRVLYARPGRLTARAAIDSVIAALSRPSPFRNVTVFAPPSIGTNETDGD